MAGYSGTPLVQKLGIKAGGRVLLIGAPAGFAAALAPLPEGAAVVADTPGPLDAILLFVTAHADLTAGFAPAAARRPGMVRPAVRHPAPGSALLVASGGAQQPGRCGADTGPGRCLRRSYGPPGGTPAAGIGPGGPGVAAWPGVRRAT